MKLGIAYVLHSISSRSWWISQQEMFATKDLTSVRPVLVSAMYVKWSVEFCL